jgi:inner membrane protein
MMKSPVIKKVLMIAFLTGLLLIPLVMIENLVYERSSYRNQASHDIASSWTGEQQFLGPLLVVPYMDHSMVKVWDKELKRYEMREQILQKRLIIAPEKLEIDGKVNTETRKRGIYAVPVYHSKLAVSGRFDLSRLEEVSLPAGHRLEWEPAYLSLMVNDVRGVEVQPSLEWGGTEIEFVSDTRIDGMRDGMHAPLGILKSQDDPVVFSFDLRLNGMELLQFSPVGKTTRVTVDADWPDPSFMGRYLPTTRTIDDNGFRAVWSLSSFASGIPQQLESCESGNCRGLLQETFGVKLFNSVDIYQQSERSIKYALLFIGLTFVSFFIHEVMKGLRLHPMQYLLVGLELSVFYLLLISLSEHMIFSVAYLVATLASTLLIGFYISGVLRSARHGGLLGAGLLLLYGMLYGILRSEDNSLLMGSLLIFVVLGLVMIVTRHLDWYSVTDDVTARLTSKNRSEQADG